VPNGFLWYYGPVFSDQAMKLLRKARSGIYPRRTYVDPWGPDFDLECSLIHSRFVNFTKRLPRPLATRALDMRTYLGKSAQPRRSKPITDCIPVIAVLPYVLRGCFPVELERLRTLAYGLTLGGLYAMAEDKLIDSQASPALSHTLLAPSLYCEFLRTLHGIFPPGSAFWTYHDRFFREYQMAELAHGNEIGRTGRTHPRRYCNIVRAKSAPMKLAVCGMGILSGREEHISQILKSFDHWIVGHQLHDDIVDWREDYCARRQSLIGAKIGRLVRAGRNACPLSELTRAVHSSDVIESMLEESARWFARAEKSAVGIDCGDWIRFVRDFASVTSATVRDLVTLKAAILLGH